MIYTRIQKLYMFKYEFTTNFLIDFNMNFSLNEFELFKNIDCNVKTYWIGNHVNLYVVILFWGTKFY